ncbi:hypothetical protein RJ639_014145 [Escallonia herrerae]|uniref:Pentatricopeptide repeat-containing protein n=1 Tax=Escallonia herrerae TaxID=1293975 RepID=A0AA88VKG4_9ASTE|nr:hypothetical protein RJ639_014145 [Escallonia herrerae]
MKYTLSIRSRLCRVIERSQSLCHSHTCTVTRPQSRPPLIESRTRPLMLGSSATFQIFFSSFTCSLDALTSVAADGISSDYDDEHGKDGDDDHDDGNDRLGRQVGSLGIATIMDLIRAPGSSCSSCSDFKDKLEHCGVTPSPELVVEVLSRVRNNWEAAFTFFLWAGRQPGYAHTLRQYHLMISILGKMRKFDTAWTLIHEMRGGKHGRPSLVTPHTLLIMIRRYCAVHDVAKAINTFYAYKRFNFEIGLDDFHNLLSALCRYKNVKDAEHLLFCNRKVFPLTTKSFNIILNGWCNVIGNSREAKRIWREMSERRIFCDVVSYASIISCFSKAGRINDVLKLFKQMEVREIVPDRKVYNAVIHALAKGRFVREACNLMKEMEDKGVAPNVVTYNSLIMPLCNARQLEEAERAFHEMLERGLSPTVRTYHAFFRVSRMAEEVFALLQKMNLMGCHPNHDTYIMLIRKFCRWRQLENVTKLWNEMSQNGLDPDRSSYIVLIHGLFLNGMLDEANKYYLEMKEKHLLPEPKIDEMLQAWVAGKQDAGLGMAESKDTQEDCRESGNNTSVTSKKIERERDFRRQPEVRRVVRERGFSFWEQ